MDKRHPIPPFSLPVCPLIISTAAIGVPRDELTKVTFVNTVEGRKYKLTTWIERCEKYTDCDSMSIVEVE